MEVSKSVEFGETFLSTEFVEVLELTQLRFRSLTAGIFELVDEVSITVEVGGIRVGGTL